MDTTALAKLEGRRRGRQANRESGSALGEWVKSTRTAQGVSQRELADRAGLSRSYVCDIEHGRSTKPSFECLENISKALGVEQITDGVGPTDATLAISRLPDRRSEPGSCRYRTFNSS